MKARFHWLGALLAFSAVPGFSATTTANLSVTATVTATCAVATSPVAFGVYDPTGADLDTAGAVTITCTSGTTYSVALDAGASPSTPGDATTRRMVDGANFLPYALYLDAGRATVWGDGLNGTSLNPTAGTFTGDGTAQARTVYGRITAGQYVPPGAYADTVVATVTYN